MAGNFFSRFALVLLMFISTNSTAQDAVVDSIVPMGSNQYFLDKSSNDSFTFEQKHVNKERISRLRSSKDFWYADYQNKKKSTAEEKDRKYIPLGQHTWFQVLLWIVIIGAFASALVWYLAGNNIRLFRKRSESIASDTIEEQMPEDIFAIRYQKEIEKAVNLGNYRLAVRLLFLKLLKELADKQIIQYKQDRTNLDYLLQLNKTQYYSTFSRLTRHYEYSWYGHFEVDKHAYEIIQTDFETMGRQIEMNRA